MEKINNFKSDEEIKQFLQANKASDIFIKYVLVYPDCPSVSTWRHHWELGFKDFGGGFGTSLFEGDIESALACADSENKPNLVKLLQGLF